MAVKGIEDLKPVYLIFGEEDLLLERALQRLRARIGEVADLDFNSDSFDGESADPRDIVAAANTLPFASERRLVVVRDVDKMPAADQAVLAEYARDPSPSACLVLVARKIRKDSKLYRAVDALGGVAEYKPPKRSEYPARVVELFASKGRRLSLDGAEVLVRTVGRDLRRLEVEADKVIAFAGARTDLDRSDVETVIADTAPVSVFDFLGALGSRECGTALELLDRLLDAGESLIGIHAMTVRHLRTLVSVRALLDRGEGQGAVQRLGMPDWQARDAMGQAKRFTAAELSCALRGAAEVEGALKTGQGDQRVTFEVWVVGFCRTAG